MESYKLSPAIVKARIKKVKCGYEELCSVAGITKHQLKHYLIKHIATDDVISRIIHFFETDYYKQLENANAQDFKCTPPQSCFTCPYPDCRNNSNTVRGEAIYNRSAWAKDWVGAT